jgi:molecular chaperone DnaK
MKKEAELHLEEDRKKRELIEIKNQAENTIYLAEKTSREAGDKITPEERKEIEDKISDLKEVSKGEDASQIKNKMEDLSLAISKIGAKMYQSNQNNNSNDTQPNSSSEKSDDNNSQDAEFKE